MKSFAWKSGNARSASYLSSLLLVLPCAASAEIYRCESRGDAYFSQIPCNDQAEAVVIEDRLMFTSPPAEGAQPPGAAAPAQTPARTPADNLNEFVETLNRQRGEEIAKADLAISGVQEQLAAAEGRPADDPELAALGDKLAELQASRSSIAAQYDAMIAEAQNRVAEMTSANAMAVQARTTDG